MASEARENVARTFAAILERRNPGLRVSVDVDTANLATLPTGREGRSSADRKEAEAVPGGFSRATRAA